MPDPNLLSAADHADALLAARRARNILALVVAAALLIQLSLFCVVRFTTVLRIDPAPLPAATQPESAPPPQPPALRLATMLHYLIGLTGFVGITAAIVLCGVLLILLQIMVVARLVGVSHVVSALVSAMLLATLLFPWQALLNNAGMTAVEFKIPGVLYTWEELTARAQFPNSPLPQAILAWSRFAAFPILALVLLLRTQLRSGRALKLALGNTTPPNLDNLR